MRIQPWVAQVQHSPPAEQDGLHRPPPNCPIFLQSPSSPAQAPENVPIERGRPGGGATEGLPGWCPILQNETCQTASAGKQKPPPPRLRQSDLRQRDAQQEAPGEEATRSGWEGGRPSLAPCAAPVGSITTALRGALPLLTATPLLPLDCCRGPAFARQRTSGPIAASHGSSHSPMERTRHRSKGGGANQPGKWHVLGGWPETPPPQTAPSLQHFTGESSAPPNSHTSNAAQAPPTAEGQPVRQADRKWVAEVPASPAPSPRP